MGQARKKYTQAYRDEAVELVVSSGRPVAQIARDLGINEATLGNWVNKSKNSEDTPDKPLSIDERAELKAAREEIRKLKMERDFLKKAAAWFASESR